PASTHVSTPQGRRWCASVLFRNNSAHNRPPKRYSSDRASSLSDINRANDRTPAVRLSDKTPARLCETNKAWSQNFVCKPAPPERVPSPSHNNQTPVSPARDAHNDWRDYSTPLDFLDHPRAPV